jgi:hypothetical protein
MSDLGAVLDVAIGLVFLYLMTSLFVTIVQEGIASFWRLRAKNLYDAIANLVDDPALDKHPEYRDLVANFYRHPLMESLYKNNSRGDAKKRVDVRNDLPLPSYVPSRIFAIALLDVLRGKDATKSTGIDSILGNAEQTIARLPEGRLKATLTLLVGDSTSAGRAVNQKAHFVSERIEGWFNDSMSRASGWYKRKAQTISLLIGFAVTVLINANTFRIAGELWHNSALRAQVAATATAYYKDQTANAAASDDVTPAAKWRDQMEALNNSSLPIGWTPEVTDSLPGFAEPPRKRNAATSTTARDVVEGKGSTATAASPPAKWTAWTIFTGWAALLFGWTVTAFAASLGAAFWFDVLGKALQIRGSGPQIRAVGSAGSAPRTPIAVAAVAIEEEGVDESAKVLAATSQRGG